MCNCIVSSKYNAKLHWVCIFVSKCASKINIRGAYPYFLCTSYVDINAVTLVSPVCGATQHTHKILLMATSTTLLQKH